MPIAYHDRVDHATVLFNHLDRLGKEINELFKKEFKEGKLVGASPSSKMQNWRASVQWLESLLIPYLGKQYKERQVILRENYAKAWRLKDLEACFEAINEQAQILILEAYSQGFMLKQTISGDYIIDETKGEDKEEKQGDSKES